MLDDLLRVVDPKLRGHENPLRVHNSVAFILLIWTILGSNSEGALSWSIMMARAWRRFSTRGTSPDGLRKEEASYLLDDGRWHWRGSTSSRVRYTRWIYLITIQIRPSSHSQGPARSLQSWTIITKAGWPSAIASDDGHKRVVPCRMNGLWFLSSYNYSLHCRTLSMKSYFPLYSRAILIQLWYRYTYHD